MMSRSYGIQNCSDITASQDSMWTMFMTSFCLKSSKLLNGEFGGNVFAVSYKVGGQSGNFLFSDIILQCHETV